MLLEWTQNNAAQLRRYYGKTQVWTWVSGTAGEGPAVVPLRMLMGVGI